MDKLEYTNKHELIFLDQTLLPLKEKYQKTKSYKDVADAIQKLKIRGAPLIGIAAAYGVVMGVHHYDTENRKNFEIHFYKVTETLRNSRPTAKNLFYALDRMTKVFEENIEKDFNEIEDLLLREADAIYDEDAEMCKRIGVNGAELITDKMTILTHCNAGELATGGIGTALGIIYTAKQQGKDLFVYADETRPLLQGSRLTAFELEQNEIDFDIIIDSMAANLMKDQMIDCVIVGADRIASNGDVVNKVGSYSLAVNCAFHKIPFYVAAPGSTIDFETAAGKDIEIEERDPDEVTKVHGEKITLPEYGVMNPAFDLVPNELITAIITEYKVHYPPYNFGGLKQMFSAYIQTLRKEEED
ncbi:MAG TPA: S-methyl-5-thioribose-1-phosphate isomerase [Ignavibacteria bacterium]|nr:S-methyl-5-thioribose-1-phosphate isomerase [Ignavibacteria bacterium]HRJ05722.1 S-methyl-5-thioribose-1-phosphate isomerase [Ignavibacteria bacterium]